MTFNREDDVYREAAERLLASIISYSTPQLKRLAISSHKSAIKGNEQADLIADIALYALARRVGYEDLIEFVANLVMK